LAHSTYYLPRQDLLQPSHEETARRVKAEMTRKPTKNDPFKELKTKDVRVVDAAVAKAVMEESARHFVAIRNRYLLIGYSMIYKRLTPPLHRFASQFKRSANVQFWVPMYETCFLFVLQDLIFYSYQV